MENVSVKNELNKALSALVSMSDIPPEYMKFKFTDYKLDLVSRKVNDKKTIESIIQSRKNALNFVAEYVRNIKSNVETGRSVLLVGKATSGKTLLATLILKAAIAKTFHAKYVRFLRLITEANTSNLNDERVEFENRYISPTVLCIDEIEESELNEKQKNYISHILSERRLNRRPTILTSKITQEEIRYVCGKNFHNAVDDRVIYYKPVNILTASVDSDIATEDWLTSTHKYNAARLVDSIKVFAQGKYGKKNAYVNGYDLIKLLRQAIDD